jgi:hypothetical protein
MATQSTSEIAAATLNIHLPRRRMMALYHTREGRRRTNGDSTARGPRGEVLERHVAKRRDPHRARAGGVTPSLSLPGSTELAAGRITVEGTYAKIPLCRWSTSLFRCRVVKADSSCFLYSWRSRSHSCLPSPLDFFGGTILAAFPRRIV